MADLKMPERPELDVGVAVSKDLKGRVWITAGDKGLEVSTYNAWRIVGLLAVLLGIPLAKQAAKAIKL